MTEKSRRTVLKGLAITMPAVWATPIVESVILPAHAGGSIDCSRLPTLEECGLLEGQECIECQNRNIDLVDAYNEACDSDLSPGMVSCGPLGP